MSDRIYHITSRINWEKAQREGEYQADSLASAGFIHCSSKEQVLRVANNFYRDQPSLMLLEIDPSQLKEKLRWEAGTDAPDELFPHIYGPINLDAVKRTFDLSPNQDGSFSFPQP